MDRSFLDKAGIELSRAERYRIFVSLSVMDLEPARQMAGEAFVHVLPEILERVKTHVRGCDQAELVGEGSLALLFPETSRQEAEVVVRRLSDIVRSRLEELTGKPIPEMIPVEIASYPDTAGAKTMGDFLDELGQRH